ncbi:putative HTH-type transcriptional regulator [Burkholderiaceae bacterium]|nr:putative HTH-type transcriptional regulator [Burkholderiaceae bacterium]
MVSSRSPKHTLFTRFAALAKAMAHPLRLELLEQLAQGERSVQRLADRVGTPVANASQHLRHLHGAGLVTARREEKYVVYALADAAVLELLAALRRVSERSDATVREVVQGYFAERDAMEALTRGELIARYREGLVTVLDVRPEDEYELAHLPGAVNIPLEQLGTRLAQLDRSHDIVAYCRGPYCVLSYEAVELLRGRGFKVRRLEDGLPEWRLAGLPVASGPAAKR